MRPLLVFVTAVFSLSAFGALPSYNVVDLGPGSAIAISENGNVLGSTNGQLWRYIGGSRKNLPYSRGSGAGDINDVGQVAAEGMSSGQGSYEAFYFDGTAGHTYTYDYNVIALRFRSINESGVAVGYGLMPGDVGSDDFCYENGWQWLSPWHGGAVTIRNNGEIAYNREYTPYPEGMPNENEWKSIWVGGRPLAMPDPEAVYAYPINFTADGSLVGCYCTPTNSPYVCNINEHWFTWNGQQFKIVLEGTAETPLVLDFMNGNSNGDLVGYDLCIDGTLGSVSDLESAGWTITYAYDINDAGQIVGTGVNAAGETRAVLLNPIPEPATTGILLDGLIMLLKRWRR